MTLNDLLPGFQGRMVPCLVTLTDL